MLGNSTVTITMIPSGSQFPQTTAKRKADDSNPLVAAAKRLKKDKSSSNKRKLLNAEETPTGLFIVRAPPTQDSSYSASQPLPSPSYDHSQIPPRHSSSQPLTRASSTSSSSQPPNKKIRGSSQPPSSSSQSQPPPRYPHSAPSPIPEDPELETAVRAMNDEADHLRRQSRIPTVMDQNISPAFAFARPTADSMTGGNKKGKGKEIITDTSLPLTQDETPQIQRNKRLREGAMAAIVNEREGEEDERVGRGQERRSDHRRKSSLSRGKRISSGFETTGIITSPHNSVSETSFYKHIDCDLPDSERLRQLLIWCSIRASGSTTFSSSSTPSKPKSTPANVQLPKLSAKATQVLRKFQDDAVRMLAERKIDLSLYGGPDTSYQSGPSEGELRENEQNSKNKQFEVKYSQEIRRAEEEEDQWKKVSYRYDEYCKRFSQAMEKRVAEAASSSSLSAKAKGKRRLIETEEDLDDILPDIHDLPPDLRKSLDLTRIALLPTSSSSRETSSSSSANPPQSTVMLTTLPGTNMTRTEAKTKIDTLLPDVSYKLDRLHSFVNAARTTTRVAEDILDDRFKLLVDNLEKRRTGGLEPNSSSSSAREGAGGGVDVVRNYVRREAPPLHVQDAALASSSSGIAVSTSSAKGGGLIDLMRALSRIDTARPPSKIGDTVRRAAREVQRIGESGGRVGDRRLTAVYPPGILSGGGGPNNAPSGGSGMMMTPRKVPGTPRRHTTPGRDRERTPGR